MEVIYTIIALIGAVILGGLIVTIVNAYQQKSIIKILLAFSGGFMLAIAFNHFLPELYASHSRFIGMYIILGFLIQLVLEYFSGGIEHGHVHLHSHSTSIPWMMFISLSVHSFIEGIPLAITTGVEHLHAHGHHHGHDHSHLDLAPNSLLLGIIFHQIPVAIALMTVLKSSHFSNKKAWAVLMLFAIMTPLGLLFGVLTEGKIGYLNMDILLAIVVGMFLHISTTIIFEASENHHFNIVKLASIIVGVALALVIQ